jgi:hypothetical protein
MRRVARRVVSELPKEGRILKGAVFHREHCVSHSSASLSRGKTNNRKPTSTK